VTRCALTLYFFSVSFILMPGTASDARADEGSGGTEADSIVEALQQGYLANREAFSAFTCTFVWKDGGANTMEEALAGELFNVMVKNGLWIVDGKRQRYEILCADPEQEKLELDLPKERPPDGRGLVVGSTGCISRKILAGETLGLSYVPLLSTANIGWRFATQPQISHTPFSMGVMGINESLTPALRQTPGRDVSRRYGGQRTVEGVLCEVLLISSGNVLSEWSLDPRRGFLPIELRRYSRADMYLIDNYLGLRTLVTHVRQGPNGAYFPERSVTFTHPHAPMATRAHIIEVQELELTRPDPAALAVELPAGTNIVEQPTMLASIRMAESGWVHVDDLDAWVERCREARAAKLEGRPPRDASPSPSPSSSPPPRAALRLVLVLVSLAMLLWLAGIHFRRRIRTGSSPGRA
jgi:hypothetical protein